MPVLRGGLLALLFSRFKKCTRGTPVLCIESSPGWSATARRHHFRLTEQSGSKIDEVLPPHRPRVVSRRHRVFMLDPLFLEQDVEFVVALEEKVLVAAADPEKPERTVYFVPMFEAVVDHLPRR